jgi:NodT family efflux transporter outer membrane factor (OMF) lipoprotein
MESDSMHPGASYCRKAGGGKLLPFVLLWVALVAVSCTPAVPSVPLSPALPAHFTATGTEVPAEQWWTSFDDPILNELVAQAFSGNPGLQAAWSRLSQAEAVARRVGADLAPTLDAAGRAAHLRNDDGIATRRTDTVSFGLAAAYEVDLWGRIRSERDAAVLDAAASREDIQAAAQSLAARVASTWFQLVEQYGQLELLDRQLRTNEQILELVTMRFRRGQVGAADVLQQRELIEANLGQQAQVKAQAGVLTHALAILRGLPPVRTEEPRIAVLPQPPPLPVTGVPAELIRRRPDLISASNRVMAAEKRTAAALAERFPRLSLSANLESESSRSADLFANWLANLAANLSGPLLDGGRLQAEADRTAAAAAEALHFYGETVLAALAEVEDALVREEGQRQFLSRLARQLEMAELVTERVRYRYLRGTEEYLRVLNALLTQQVLERNRLTAHRQLLQERIDLYRALGGGVLVKEQRSLAGRQQEKNKS